MPDELTQSGNQIRARAPEAWEAAMQPIANVQVREVQSRQFTADLTVFELPRTAAFSLKLSRSRVLIPDGSGFVGVTMVEEGGVSLSGRRTPQQWTTGSSNVVNHEHQQIDFTSGDNLDCVAFCFRQQLLDDYAQKYHRGNSPLNLTGSDLRLDSDAGARFSRRARFIWEQLKRGGVPFQSTIASEEIEDDLWSLLLAAISDRSATKSHEPAGSYTTYVKRAEAFICGHLKSPISVTDIATAVQISVPTLNRAFRKCHGMGPKAFLKRRRLERAAQQLRAADLSETTVTAVATENGFWHLGQFAVDYRKAHGESPSATLRRKP